MTIAREPIYAALFALVTGATGFKTIGRRLKSWTELKPTDQPALYQSQVNEMARSNGMTTVWVLHINLYLYAHSTPTEPIPASQINALLDAVERALAGPYPGARQTLGGLVARCSIVGTIQTDEGTLGDQAFAVIPIELELPA